MAKTKTTGATKGAGKKTTKTTQKPAAKKPASKGSKTTKSKPASKPASKPSKRATRKLTTIQRRQKAIVDAALSFASQISDTKSRAVVSEGNDACVTFNPTKGRFEGTCAFGKVLQRSRTLTHLSPEVSEDGEILENDAALAAVLYGSTSEDAVHALPTEVRNAADLIADANSTVNQEYSTPRQFRQGVAKAVRSFARTLRSARLPESIPTGSSDAALAASIQS